MVGYFASKRTLPERYKLHLKEEESDLRADGYSFDRMLPLDRSFTRRQISGESPLLDRWGYIADLEITFDHRPKPRKQRKPGPKRPRLIFRRRPNHKFILIKSDWSSEDYQYLVAVATFEVRRRNLKSMLGDKW
jgi:hypothetical protein